jgi:hypothetical protein
MNSKFFSFEEQLEIHIISQSVMALPTQGEL